MKISKLLTIIFCLGIFTNTLAQTNISFKEEVFDFGFIKEGDRVSHVFSFENIGDDTLKLINVKPSCGCTSPNWPRSPFLEGEEGEIDISYNSRGRVGKFYKSIKVTTNTSDTIVTLYIKGVVLGKNELPSDSLVKSFKANGPNLSFQKETVNLGKSEVGKTVTTKLIVTNNGTEKVNILRVSAGCKCVRSQSNIGIEIGESIEYEINYTPKKVGDHQDKIVLLTTEIDNPVYEVVLETETVKTLTEPKGIMHEDTPSGFGF